MALVPAKPLLQDALEGRYAIGAFNLNNMEILQAIITAAEEERAPVILQASQGALRYAGLPYITALARAAAEESSVPIALNLDHGTSFEQIMGCLRYGFTTIMYDGSKYPLEENIARTKKVVEACHAVGVSVEGELGRIAGTEDDISVDEKDAYLVNPDEAVRLVRETGIDYLAPAVGTAHGAYKADPEIDFDRLRETAQKTGVPMVLHGASGVPDDDIRRAVSLGVAKINIDTELRQAFSGAVRKFAAANPDVIDPRKILGPAREAMKERVRAKIRLFGSSGRA